MLLLALIVFSVGSLQLSAREVLFPLRKPYLPELRSCNETLKRVTHQLRWRWALF